MARAVVAAALAVGGAGAATPTRGGTLVIARPPLTCLNPFAQGCNASHVEPVLTQVLEGAFEVGPDLVFRPNLVSRVEIARNPFRLTYHIRPQARWSDGVPVSSADFHFTYRTFLTRGVAAIPELRDSYAKIRRFRTLGQKSFRVELREPLSDWRSLFDIVLPRHVLAREDITAVWRDRIDDPRTGRPIGNGPFLVERLRPGQQLTLVRNPRYWRRHAYLDRLVWALPRYDASDELGALRRNEVHMSGVLPGLRQGLSREHARAIARLPGWRVSAWPTLSKEQLAFRLGPGGSRRSAAGSSAKPSRSASTGSRSPAGPTPSSARGHAHSTVPCSSRGSRATGRTGAATVTTPAAPASCSNAQAAAVVQTASTCAPGSGCGCASTPPPATPSASSRSGSSRISSRTSASRYVRSTSPTPHSSTRSSAAATSTSPSTPGRFRPAAQSARTSAAATPAASPGTATG